VASYEVILKDRTVEVVDGADAYKQEGPMTTFFLRADGRAVVDCWSTRVASVRTSEVMIIRSRAAQGT
jgi:serine/threonine-protein kinase RIO1